MLEVGYYSQSTLHYYATPIELEPTDLTEDITVEVAVSNAPDNFTPQCVYAASYDAAGGTIWSTAGVTMFEYRAVEGIVVCKSKHNSRFTANENMTETEIAVEVQDIEVKEGEEDDDKESDSFPVMIVFSGGLVIVVMFVTILERKVR